MPNEIPRIPRASAPTEIDGDWLAIAHEVEEAAATARRVAADLQRQADKAFERAGIRSEGEPKNEDRILWNERPPGPRGGGDIDEIVLHDVMVHVEQMDNRCWWIGVYRDNDRFAGNFSCDSRGRMTFSMQEDDLPWDRDDCHEERACG